MVQLEDSTIFSKLDLLAHPYKFLINQKRSFGTGFGSFLSFILITILGVTFKLNIDRF